MKIARDVISGSNNHIAVDSSAHFSKSGLIIISVIIFTVGTCLGLAVGFSLKTQEESNSNRIRLNPSFKYINPLLECDSTIESFTSFGNLEKQLHAYVASEIRDEHTSSTSIYVRDLNNGPWIGVNEKEQFSPASLIKVPLLIAYLKLAETNPQLLDTLVTINNTDGYLDQNIKPTELLRIGQQYKYIELLRQMIAYSDNVAYNVLLSKIDHPYLVATYKDFGIDISQGMSDPTGNILSVKDYASFFRILFNASYLSDTRSELALKILTQSTYNDGLRTGVPADVEIAHKFGERRYLATSEVQLHDCGIIYVPGKPYLLCVMTRGKDIDQLGATIAEISRLVYQRITR